MAYFAVLAGTVIAVVSINVISISDATVLVKTAAKKANPPSEQFDTWQCMPTWVPFGQTNCMNINKAQATGTGTKSTGCGWKMPVFCNEATNAAVIKKQAALPAGAAAPVGYKLYPGAGSYKIYTDNKTWAEAKVACEAEGAGMSLAVPSTRAEYDAVKDMMDTVLPKEQKGIWLGISDVVVEGDFRTVFDQPLCNLPLVLWNAQEPNDYNKREDCLGIGFLHADMPVDYFCGEKMAFMCEKPLPERLTACRRSA